MRATRQPRTRLQPLRESPPGGQTTMSTPCAAFPLKDAQAGSVRLSAFYVFPLQNTLQVGPNIYKYSRLSSFPDISKWTRKWLVHTINSGDRTVSGRTVRLPPSPCPGGWVGEAGRPGPRGGPGGGTRQGPAHKAGAGRGFAPVQAPGNLENRSKVCSLVCKGFIRYTYQLTSSTGFP